MRLYELFDEDDHKKDIRSDDDPADNRLSPLTIPPKDFIFSRASGPLGMVRKDGSVKKKYKDIIKKGDPINDPRLGSAYGKEAMAAKIARTTPSNSAQDGYSGNDTTKSFSA